MIQPHIESRTCIYIHHGTCWNPVPDEERHIYSLWFYPQSLRTSWRAVRFWQQTGHQIYAGSSMCSFSHSGLHFCYQVRWFGLCPSSSKDADKLVSDQFTDSYSVCGSVLHLQLFMEIIRFWSAENQQQMFLWTEPETFIMSEHNSGWRPDTCLTLSNHYWSVIKTSVDVLINRYTDVLIHVLTACVLRYNGFSLVYILLLLLLPLLREPSTCSTSGTKTDQHGSILHH